MNKLNLDPGAKYLLSSLQQQQLAKPISRQIEAKIADACTQAGETALTLKQLEAVLVQAMPESSQAIKNACSACVQSGYHPDGTNANFITQFVGIHTIEKEVARPVQNPTPPTLWRPMRDPLYAKFVMDNDAQVMLIFNARDVDERGRPLLMKVVAREGTKLEKLDFKQFRTRWADQPDVQMVPKDAAYVEIKDTQEQEFNFGDPLLQLSLSKDMKELSRGVTVNPDNKRINRHYNQNPDGTPNLNSPYMHGGTHYTTEETGAALDTIRPNIFDQRIQLHMNAKANFPQGGWLDTRSEFIEARMVVEPGLIFEPNKRATVQLLDKTVTTEVPKTDAYMLGSPSEAADLTSLAGANAALTIAKLLAQNVTRTVQSIDGGNADVAQDSFQVFRLIYANAKDLKVGALELEPLGDRLLKKSEIAGAGIQAVLSPIQDPQLDGTRVTLDLAPGFLAAANGSSVQGWKVVVGFSDADGTWKQAEEVKIDGSLASQKFCFSLDMADAPKLMQQGKTLEIRLFNENGVPAQRVKVPFQAMPWGPAVIGKTEDAPKISSDLGLKDVAKGLDALFQKRNIQSISNNDLAGIRDDLTLSPDVRSAAASLLANQAMFTKLETHAYGNAADGIIGNVDLKSVLSPTKYPSYTAQWQWPNELRTYNFTPDAQGWIHDHFITDGGQHGRVFYNVATKELEVRHQDHTGRDQPLLPPAEATPLIKHAKKTIFNDTQLKVVP